MRRLPLFIGASLASSAVLFSASVFGNPGSTPFVGTAEAQSVGSGPCHLNQAAFCETFDQPAGTGNRSGQLNGTLWGVSRTSGENNAGQGIFDFWAPTQVQACSGTVVGQPDATDILVCNGQVREATTDNGNVTTLAMYPKQPFDFAGRTGIVTFDVSNDTQGSHAAWPEFWITDQPVPAPFAHEASWVAAPRNGLGIRFAGYVNAQGQGASCPEGSPTYVGVDSAITVSNYVANDTGNGGNLAIHGLDCVKTSTGPGQFNHYEIHVSQSLIDIYGTDAGTLSPLKHLAQITNPNLTFSRGVVWIEDAHYNGNKFNSQGTHTFSWDNVGFDGPVVDRDLTFDVPDSLTPSSGSLNLAWSQGPNVAQTKTIAGVTNVSAAAAALLTFNFSPSAIPSTFTYAVNGHVHTAPWPYPDTDGSSWRTLALPVPLGDVVTGTNTVTIASNQAMLVANVDIILVGAGGGGSSNSDGSQGAGVPVLTPTPTVKPASATPTSTALPTSTVKPTATSVAQTGVSPTCVLSQTLAGPPKQIQITVRDTGSGLKSVRTTIAVNANVVIPAFTQGTRSPVVVTATKVNQTQNSTVALLVTDMAGNVTTANDP